MCARPRVVAKEAGKQSARFASLQARGECVLLAEFRNTHSAVHIIPLDPRQLSDSTASQGQTIRTGVTIDCARIEPKGNQGTKDADWWLHLYVMFSRATCMEDMLPLRPPPREVLEAGPPANVRAALQRFEQQIAQSKEEAVGLAGMLDISLPP